MSIWNAADNEKLKSYFLELWNGPSTGHSKPEVFQHYKASTIEHIAILKYIQEQNSEQARKTMQQHISRSMDNILKHYTE